MNELLKDTIDTFKTRVCNDCAEENLSKSERILSVISGGFIFGVGLKRIFSNPITGLSSLAIGGALVYRGVTGHCTVKKVLENAEEEEDFTIVEHRYFVK